MDLLTVVMHELGNALGLDDVAASDGANSLMAESLARGIRRLPGDGSLSDPSSDPTFVRRFDFGTKSSPLDPTHLRVSERTEVHVRAGLRLEVGENHQRGPQDRHGGRP